MHLTIIRPTEKKEYTINSLEAESSKGSFVIEPNHAPLIARLAPGKPMSFTLQNGTVERLIIPDGILKLENNIISIILTQ